ncbi:hypothetical protein ACTXT7_005705 [Hymenolepis weldensis]
MKRPNYDRLSEIVCFAPLGWTPLHVAAHYSQRLFIRTLVETYHAKNDIMDYSGKFPVDLLATEELKEELTEIVQLLSQGRIARIRKNISEFVNPTPSKFIQRSQSILSMLNRSVSHLNLSKSEQTPAKPTITELHHRTSTTRSRDSSMSDEIQSDIDQAKSFSTSEQPCSSLKVAFVDDFENTMTPVNSLENSPEKLPTLEEVSDFSSGTSQASTMRQRSDSGEVISPTKKFKLPNPREFRSHEDINRLPSLKPGPVHYFLVADLRKKACRKLRKESSSSSLSLDKSNMESDLETMWNSRKTSVTNGKKIQGTDDSKVSESEIYTQLLLSTLGRDSEYATNMFRRLQRRDFAYATPEALLEELKSGIETDEERAKKKGHSLKRGSVFKVPHLPHPPKNSTSGGSAMASAASGLMKMGETVKKSFQKQKNDSRKYDSLKIMKKNSVSTLSIRRGKKNVPGSMERHSIAGIEYLTSRMTIGGPIRGGMTLNTPVETLDSRGVSIFRHASNLSDFISR